MGRVLVSLFVASSLTVVAAAVSAAAPAAPAKGKVVVGKALAAGAATPVAEIMSAPAKFQGKALKVTGVVTKVCQTSGCWFEVAPAANAKEAGLRITSADHTLYVPKDAAGRVAVPEGMLVVKKGEPKKDHDHGGEGHSCETAPDQLLIHATGIELN